MEAASLEHQFVMPTVPEPESLPTEEVRWKQMLQDDTLGPVERYLVQMMLQRRDAGDEGPILTLSL